MFLSEKIDISMNESYFDAGCLYRTYKQKEIKTLHEGLILDDNKSDLQDERILNPILICLLFLIVISINCVIIYFAFDLG